MEKCSNNTINNNNTRQSEDRGVNNISDVSGDGPSARQSEDRGVDNISEVAGDGPSARQSEDRGVDNISEVCLLYTSPSPRDKRQSRMPSSA